MIEQILTQDQMRRLGEAGYTLVNLKVCPVVPAEVVFDEGALAAIRATMEACR